MHSNFPLMHLNFFLFVFCLQTLSNVSIVNQEKHVRKTFFLGFVYNISAFQAIFDDGRIHICIPKMLIKYFFYYIIMCTRRIRVRMQRVSIDAFVKSCSCY